MRISLIISFSMHIAVVAAAFVVLPEAEKFKVKKTEPIPVEILTISEFSKLMAKSDDKKELEKPKPEPKKKVEPKPAPKKKQAKVVPPKPPEPKPLAPKIETPPPPKLKKVEKAPEPEKKKVETKPAPKSVPVPRVRPKFAQIKPKKKRKFNSRKIAALLNKLPEDKPDTATSPEKKPRTTKNKSRFNGRDATISASEKDLLRQKIGKCWSTPVGVKDAEKLIVKIKIRLKRDGTLARPPQVLDSNSEIAADSALRAIRRCGPYDMFSPKKYNTWREIVLNFDPSEMFGG
jgi:outer membrane biosynthesis protein TonB